MLEPDSSLRLFIGIPFAKNVENNLESILARLRPKSRDVKWVPAENIHLTLKFLGNQPPALVPSTRDAIDTVAGDHQPVKTTINSLKAFPNLHRPRVIWAGFENGVDRLTKIAIDIDRQMVTLGLEPERRPFAPHLTLGRVRRGMRVDSLAEYLADYEMEPFEVALDKIVLFKSTLTPAGARYERLHEAALAADRFSG